MNPLSRKRATGIILFVVLLAISCNKKDIQQPAERGSQYRSENVHLVSEATARQVAENFNPAFFSRTASGSEGSGEQVRADKARLEQFPDDVPEVPGTLAGRNNIKKVTKFSDHSGLPAFYTFSFENNKGFLIVAADSGMRPVLAYVPRGEFDANKLPGGLTDWIDKTTANVEIARRGLVDTRKNIASWKAYENSMRSPGAMNHATATAESQNLSNERGANFYNPNTNPCNDPDYTSGSQQTVGPLLPTEWGQADGYNDHLGYAACFTSWNGRYPTGCVTTAMAQVIRYWQSPNSFNYSLMPNNSGNYYVQQLMQAAGTSVYMIYDCAGSHPFPGWGPACQKIADGLQNNFYYSSASWAGYNHSGGDYLTITANINASRPVILLGSPGNGEAGHCWVVDGYQQTTYMWCDNGNLTGCSYLYFHMNWGWNEVFVSSNFNGWYAYDNWAVNGEDFNYYKSFVYNIHP